VKRLVALVVLPVLFAGCSSAADDEVVETGEIVVDDTVESIGEMPDVFELTVIVGENSGSDQMLTVPSGSTVRLTFVNPNEDDEFHLHGYDLGGAKTEAGKEARFEFVADEPGLFEVESHVTGELLMVLVVE